jgi:hypothetical protein
MQKRLSLPTVEGIHLLLSAPVARFVFEQLGVWRVNFDLAKPWYGAAFR